MSSQNPIGFTSNCLLNQPAGSPFSRSRTFNNNLVSAVKWRCDYDVPLNSGQSTIEYFYNNGAVCSITNTNTNTVRIALFKNNILPSPFYASWVPICTTVSMCSASLLYVGGGSTLLINYFGDQYTIYKMDSNLNFPVVSKNLIVDGSLGTYWQFSVSTNDFIVVVTGTTQYQLKFIESGFYYFSDMSSCGANLNLGSSSTTNVKSIPASTASDTSTRIASASLSQPKLFTGTTSLSPTASLRATLTLPSSLAKSEIAIQTSTLSISTLITSVPEITSHSLSSLGILIQTPTLSKATSAEMDIVQSQRSNFSKEFTSLISDSAASFKPEKMVLSTVFTFENPDSFMETINTGTILSTSKAEIFRGTVIFVQFYLMFGRSRMTFHMKAIDFLQLNVYTNKNGSFLRFILTSIIHSRRRLV